MQASATSTWLQTPEAYDLIEIKPSCFTNLLCFGNDVCGIYRMGMVEMSGSRLSWSIRVIEYKTVHR